MISTGAGIGTSLALFTNLVYLLFIPQALYDINWDQVNYLLKYLRYPPAISQTENYVLKKQ